MANVFLNDLLGSLDDENVGDSIEKTITSAIGAKVKTSLSSSKDRVKTDLGSSKNKVKTDLSSASAKVKTTSGGMKLSGRSASFKTGVRNAVNTMMNGVGESDNVGQTIEDNIMSAFTNKFKSEKDDENASDLTELKDLTDLFK